MSETPELKCCPFCGCARVEYDTGAIECYQCAARGPAEIKVHVAAAEWNRRTTDAELVALRAEHLTDEDVERLQRDLADIRAEFEASDADTIRGLRAELAAREAEVEELRAEKSRLERELAALLRYGIGVAASSD